MTNFWAEFFIVLGAEAALLVIAAAVVQGFTKSAAWRRTIWQACFIGLAVLLTCEMFGARSAVKGIFVPRQVNLPTSPSVPSVVVPTTTPRAVPLITTARPIQNPKPKTQNQHEGWPGILWLGGIVVLGVLGVSRRVLLLAFRRRCSAASNPALLEQIDSLTRQLAIKRRVRVITSARLVSPISFGAWRPTICVPTNFTEIFSPAEQEAVLLHELAHVAARDFTWQWGADIVLALFWWHPLVWWAQRELRDSTEAAADETSALLANGPKVLAQCLVTLGTRFTDSAGFKALGIHGVRFRSGLGRRVQRLFSLADKGSTQLGPPGRWRSRATQFCAPIICVTAIVACGAWATTSKGENMKSWKQSLAGIAAVSLLQTVQAAPSEPGPKPNTVVAAAKRPAKSTDTTLPKLSELNVTSRNTQLMRSRLEKIVFEEVTYDGLPLGEVVRMLIAESMHRDPEKRGVNFIFGKPRFHRAPTIDPATGLPVGGGSSEPVDLTSTTIRIVPPIKDIRLIDLLEVIRRVADRPIEYTIHEYGVVFAEAPSPGENVILPTIPTLARVFKVEADTFFSGVKKTFGVDIKAQSADDVRIGLAQFLATLGVDIHAPNRSVFYNDLNGTLLVRASEEEMLLIEAAMQTLGATAPDAK
jgi:Zn-dependent protease with chaperone function